ncbi:hypothetical protein [Neisseria shayeganii]|uniref:Uncharacterized protein n=1 Tax=Neisseria shayeganii 871 TaxID=1032488 RepID=G4CG57_9NEIS|nr:hypothetical protein [Neisseria shayeganii]EGY53105.1 hypothetical protein HMPREF9371_0596 [Neisseria shayeganii 871]
MTQQFKFGDKCYHLTGDMEVIIVSDEPVIADDGSKMWRIFDEDFGYHLCSDYKLELVPHPDTVRLEKIGRLAVEAMGMAFDLDEYRRQIDETMQKEVHDK